MDKLPDFILESHIIPYLSSYDLFYKFRSLGTYYYYCARNKILTHFPEEMMKTLKKIIDFNNKEDLTKNFDEITRRTFNEKRSLLLLMIEMNISLMISKILESTRDERIIELIAFFYVITKNNEKYNLICERDFNEIQRISGEEEGVIEMRKKISDILEEDDLDFDLNDYITVYNSLDREFLLGDNLTGALYNYTRLLIEFCGTKLKFNDIRMKLELFFRQITEASEIWPKRRKFYEKSIELIAETQILCPGAKKMLGLMKKYEIENELTDYNYNKEIIENFSDVNEFENIKNNRKKLNYAIIRIHQMYSFYIKNIEYIGEIDVNNAKKNKLKNKNEKFRFRVAGVEYETGEFLFILSMIKKKYPVNEDSFLMTDNFLHKTIIHLSYKLNNSIKNNNSYKQNGKKDKNFIDGNTEIFCNSINDVSRGKVKFLKRKDEKI